MSQAADGPIPMERKNVASGTEWESTVGYSRAVRVGDAVRVSGTTATDSTGEVVAPGEPYEQTVQALKNVEAALDDAGVGLDDVVRTRLYVTDIDEWEGVADAHREFFGDIRPATSMVEVSRLIAPEMVVEIEAEAVVADSNTTAQP